ncbi:unnamed protein product [Clonostachys rhizophaga]|uniref:Nucleoside phosphorylase domain-containing protein n=1 Tax=Clonostachys rhizophaga TaxID=160324 RepID=A0A9N9YS52_9HYPO|nr:unnamed protein product [Clonostachys rhizophaga]
MAQLQPRDYTVGWICAIKPEFIAAQVFLDEPHEDPEYISQHDNNTYALGRMGKHNIAIAALPMGEYGTISAATVARDMMHTFPNIRVGLMVGIGGGAPSDRHDIRLGDIVVGTPGNGEGGLLQYDFGQNIQDREFQTTGFLNQPPPFLRTALMKLQAGYDIQGHTLRSEVGRVLEKNTRLRKQFRRPDISTDRLYQSEVTHASPGENCDKICGVSGLKLRPERDEDDLGVHYGLIASANQLMKNALVRDNLASTRDILCFEMEAAGLMNHFPCLVIRGICDYADSHKNKDWQGFAAMMAAAYAKDLLKQILPNKVESEKSIGEIISGLQIATEEQRDLSKDLLQIQKDQIKPVNGRTTLSPDIPTHKQHWMNQESGLLLVSADPGCGKSVLAKYLIDKVLPQSQETICYFFFKEGDQNTVRQALCGILHQLFSQKPDLLKHAMTPFRLDREKVTHSVPSLWKILHHSIKDPATGPVIIVIDALDECANDEFINLVQNIETRFQNGEASRLKYLLTSRPYSGILSKFHNLRNSPPNIHIRGEEESNTISQEVNRVIAYRIKQLAREKSLSQKRRMYLKQKMQQTRHRTYLWVSLVFNYLEKEIFKTTAKGIDAILSVLPTSVNEANERLLNKNNSADRSVVRKALSIVLAANRPLSLAEMNIAMSVEGSHQSFGDLDLEDDTHFQSRLRYLCGLFLSIHQGRVYFLHQTAREFLLRDFKPSTNIGLEPRWHHSITLQEAHTILAETCVLYLNLFDPNCPTPDTEEEVDALVSIHPFLSYSAKYWNDHFRRSLLAEGSPISRYALKLYNPNTSIYRLWLTLYWAIGYRQVEESPSNLTVASESGNYTVCKLLLGDGAYIPNNALALAAEKGHGSIVELLLDAGADIEAGAVDGTYTYISPLVYAVDNGHEAMVKLLLERGACFGGGRGWNEMYPGITPLMRAAGGGNVAIVRLLLEKGADPNEAEYNWQELELYSYVSHFEEGKTPLMLAAANGHTGAAKILLENGASFTTIDSDGRTPLMLAAGNGHTGVVKVLLEKGASLVAIDLHGQTPLLCAAEGGHDTVVKLLLEKGSKIEERSPQTRDNKPMTPLLWAAKGGHSATVRLLLEKGACIETKNVMNGGMTAFSYAVAGGHESVVNLLLENGANPVTREDSDPTSIALDILY